MATATAQLDKTREKYRAQVATALQEDEDPLAAYDNFVKWTVDNYPEKLIARSGLLELLEETTRQFKEDKTYRADLRYLRMWILYANYVEDPPAVFAFVLRNGIGAVYAQIYEEYAVALAACGRTEDAEKVFQTGIQRRVRPLERLKKRYAEFQSKTLRLPAKSKAIWEGASPETLELRRNPLKHYPPQPARPTKANATKPGPSSSKPLPSNSAPSSSRPSSSNPTHPSSKQPPSSSSPAAKQDPYAHIRAPPVPGKRAEKLRFNLGLLLTEDNVEYSIQEARARSMGLLGKKWGPPSRATVDDDGQNNTRKMKKFTAEPTFTLATKEALADVFGMYNSPEKTNRFGVAGSKHAPVRRVEPITPMSLARLSPVSEGQAQDPDKTLMPPTDPSAGRKENSLPAPTPKFKPFVDENALQPPAVTPNPTRRALSAKEPSTLSRSTNENELRPKTPSTFRPLEEKSSATTPAAVPLASGPLSRQDIFTDDVPTPVSAAPPKIAPFVDPQPFQVFTRPQTENAPAPPRAALQALHSSGPSRQPFVPVRSGSSQQSQQPPMQSFSSSSSEDDHDAEQGQPVYIQELAEDSFDTSTSESDDADGAFAFIAQGQQQQGDEEEDSSAYDEEEDYSAPLQRRGFVNALTPITERTYEFTSTRHAGGTPDDTRRTFPYADDTDARQLVADEVEDDEDDDMGDSEEKTGTNLFDAIAAASKFIPPNPCNPFDPSIMSVVLSLIPTDPAFHDLRQEESDQLDTLQKFAKKKTRRSTSSSSVEDAVEVSLAGRPYGVIEKLGEGGFGAVFEAIDIQASGRSGQEDEDEDDEDELPKVALKVVKPRNLWEFYALRRIHLALPPQVKRSIIVPTALYAYRDESFLVLEYCNQGTLLDIVNNAPKAGITQQGACLDELLVVFFAVELMRLLESVHAAGFIHGDVKIDNCLLRLEDVPGPASAWTSVYQPSGEGGWSYKGIKMIDFGRTIDTRLFPSGQQFTGDWATDARDCLEMREGRPWTYQTDYFGLAGIIYCMLYGKYIEASSVTFPEGAERYKLSTPFKRYWNVDLWTRLFDLLLNSGAVREGGHLPLCEEMAELRKEMETWLQTNCNRGSNSLKGLLKKIGLSLLQ
ncbi:hypothetical protein EIP91_007908 [Steccherinum ochraceum]|uniref:Uncharacterized protein n=1 Tax=Steccherinum ochraceum TaxID=92696 RepID=A0A4R0RQA6_9APHY|nr:hypothetical protein EIP91_007908 [Steccherinum ochraceum]